LLPRLQSACSTGHSSETAVLKMLSDILLGIDLSAAFNDMVDHHVLLQRLEHSGGLIGLVLQWFQSFHRSCSCCTLLTCYLPLLTQLHWLKVPERIKFKLAVLVYKCLHQTAPPYLAEELHQSSADEARQRLRSASTSSLVVPRTRLSTIGDRAFPVAAVRLWNTLPLNITSASSISVFRKHLKIHLFSDSFPESPVVPVQ